MQSEKPIFKKEYEPVNHVGESVWMGNDTPIEETDYTYVFNDRYPCVKGHKLFIPKQNNAEHVGKSYGLAYQYGNDKVKTGEIDGFNVGMNMGISAGQTIMWPHIHFIPRHKGDAKEIGGMRHAHPGADHRKYY